VTDRLELVPLSPAFLEAVISGRRTEAERIAGLSLPVGWPDEVDARWLRIRLEEMQKPGWQTWLVRAMMAIGDRRMVGHIGFHGPPDEIGRAEMGYTVFAEYRRRGYAAEAAMGMMDWACARHGVTRFYLAISPDNAPSLAMAAKLGFARIGEQMDEEDGLEYVFELVVS
jgi:RimJ/RimL family protein N-acetyltransferase